jgi:hypothetical protein
MNPDRREIIKKKNLNPPTPAAGETQVDDGTKSAAVMKNHSWHLRIVSYTSLP